MFNVLKSNIAESSESDQENIAKLQGLLNDRGTKTILSDSCDKDVLGYFHKLTAGNSNSTKTEIVLCTTNLDMQDNAMIWKTLAHETGHAMQQCSGGSISDLKTFQNWESQLQGHARNAMYTIHKRYSRYNYNDEVEARMMERLPAWEVIEKYQKFCPNKSTQKS